MPELSENEPAMGSNVIRLPRPRSQRPEAEGLGFFVRVGRNAHTELLQLIATGERGFFGLVIDAHNIERHRELITEARRHDLDVILDPKTQQMGFPGGHTELLASLPWGLDRHHNVTDFDGDEGKRRAAQIVEVAARFDFTQIIGPTHLLNSANDPWLRRDIAMMKWTADQIALGKREVGLIYSLAIPMTLLRQTADRRAIIGALADAPCDAVWLKIENFGDDATGEKVAAYIDACRDFHDRGIPIVGDHIGGLPGLGALAFGAVGGIAHGVTMQQNFKASSWRRPRLPSGGGAPWRVYIPQLDSCSSPKWRLRFSRLLRGSKPGAAVGTRIAARMVFATCSIILFGMLSIGGRARLSGSVAFRGTYAPRIISITMCGACRMTWCALWLSP